MAGVHENRSQELFGGFSFDEDAISEDISFDELDKELEEHMNYDVLISILANGEKQRDSATMVEGNLGHIEHALIQDYVEDSDSLVLLYDEIHDRGIILSQIGSLLSGFQVHIGSISSEIRILQEKSLDIGVRLKNCKLVETKLAEFVKEIVAPPGLVNVIIDGEVNYGYIKSLDILSKKLRFAQVGPMINASKALKYIKPELERLRQTALSKPGMNLERLRLAVDDVLVMLAENFANPKLQQHLFLLNNYDMTISVLKEAGDEAKKLQRYFEEKPEINMMSFVDELVMEHFGDLIKFAKSHVSEDLIFYTERPNIADVEPVVKNFAVEWKNALELMHNEVVTSCSNLLSGMAILKAAMAQFLNDYNRLRMCEDNPRGISFEQESGFYHLNFI